MLVIIVKHFEVFDLWKVLVYFLPSNCAWEIFCVEGIDDTGIISSQRWDSI